MTAPTSVEIRFHGRGGQGTVTLAALTVDAAVRSGWHALGFPSFGPERTGAPVQAFVRLDHVTIRDRSEIRHPNVAVVQDPTLLGVVDVAAGLEDDGLVLLNSAGAAPAIAGANVVSMPASEIAVRHLGSAITSTAMLGFLAEATGLIGLEPACAAVRARFSGEVAERNEAAVRAAFAEAERRRVAA